MENHRGGICDDYFIHVGEFFLAGLLAVHMDVGFSFLSNDTSVSFYYRVKLICPGPSAESVVVDHEV